MGLNRSAEESVRWMLSSLDVKMVRSRLQGVDDLEEFQTWTKVYQELRDQMEPGRRDALGEALKRRHNQLEE